MVAFLPTALAFAWALSVTSIPPSYLPIGRIDRVGGKVTIQGIIARTVKGKNGDRIGFSVRGVDEVDKYALVVPRGDDYPTVFSRTYAITGQVSSVTPVVAADGNTYPVTIQETAPRVEVYNSTPFVIAGFVSLLAISAAFGLGRKSMGAQEIAEIESRVMDQVSRAATTAAAPEPAWGYLSVISSKLETDNGRYFVLRESHAKIGRGLDPLRDINLLDPEVSHTHGVIERIEGEAVFRDTGSANGSKVGGQPVTVSPVVLQHGDLIDIGNQTTLRFETVDPAGRSNRPPPPKTKKHVAGSQAAVVPRKTERVQERRENSD